MALTQRVRSVSDKTLDRMLRIAVATLVVGALAFAGIYYAGQHVKKGPSLTSRQVSSAEKAVRAAPGNIQARLQLAGAYREAKRTKDALAQYDEILKAAPEQRSALLGRGEVLIVQGDRKAAKATLQKITKAAVKGEFAGADTQLEQAFYQLGSIALTEGAPAEAVTNLKSALRIDSTDADAWYLLAVAQLKQGASQGSVVSVRRALLFVPTGWCEPYATLRDAYRKLANAPEAEYADAMFAFCEQRENEATRRLTALTTGPASVDAMLGLGVIAQQDSRRDDAIAWYRKVVAKDPTNTAAIYALSWLGARPAQPKASASTGSSHTTAGQGAH